MKTKNSKNSVSVIFLLFKYDCQVNWIEFLLLGFIEIVATYARKGKPSVAIYVKYSLSFHATTCSSILLPSANVINLIAPISLFFLER
jgi:hypothetical protein